MMLTHKERKRKMNNLKKLSYQQPEVDVLQTDLADILTTSGDQNFIPPDKDENGWT